MRRRDLLKAAITLPLLPWLTTPAFASGGKPQALAGLRARVRPGQPGWPSDAQWAQLNQSVHGRLQRLRSPFEGCAGNDDACREALAQIKNPFFLGDEPALTQTSGWVDAWTSRPSVYAVAAQDASDVAAAVNFARTHHLRLVVKGGGHSYQGTSDAPDSLLIWTRHMNAVTPHDAFVPQGCEGRQAPLPAVSVQSGAMWIDAYDAVTTHAGRYVQGGGCTTVGVAGLVQSGGFGSFSKNFGTASSNLLEAEVVTADGRVRVVNACQDPELFWAIKGGGGGSLGVVTRLTLRTHDLPDTFGAVFGAIQAESDDAYRALIARAIGFYREALFNPHWGEQLVFRGDNVLRLSMVFQGLDQATAEKIWAPFLAWVRARKDCHFKEEPRVITLPARHFWDAEFFRQHAPQLVVSDSRPGAPRNHILWAGDQGQVGQFLHGYRSAWLPQSLLGETRQAALADALFNATRHWGVSLHFNKGLAGAPDEALSRSRDTATNPGVLDAFALAIIASEGDPAFPGMPGPGPDLANARAEAARIDQSMDALLKAAPSAGSYVSESNFFERDWQTAFWGSNYPRLAAAKHRYDPEGLFFVRHGVGSEGWSEDGFTRTS
ncbi:FAD-binding oxidoreductase [Dyella solisilvae]|uniref:FAD-binding oxidoreductase n=1 Tax=Dyella solisilvae TaxID=1920168 RepID=A0A370K6Y7_9GAMM|nr:FAD-binding oxidoreductase [Dyella solisilvae]RDI98406.1 FAD-binding oxidoreductase [Dyella solisilvae]